MVSTDPTAANVARSRIDVGVEESVELTTSESNADVAACFFRCHTTYLSRDDEVTWNFERGQSSEVRLGQRLPDHRRPTLPRSAWSLATSSRISASERPAMRAAFRASTSDLGQP